MLDPFASGYLMGVLSGGAVMWAGMVVYEWLRERFGWSRQVEVDDYVARIRSLDRNTRKVP